MESDTRTRRPADGRSSGQPTISDVARIAGVSPMTVSRVINGEPNVRDTTRDKVNAAIQTLGYAPNRAARALAGAGQMRIGLLYSNPSSAYLSEFLVGSLEQASRSDVQLIVEKCEIGDHEIEVARHLAQGGIDGIILPPPLCDSRGVLKVLFEAGVPTVVVATGRAPKEAVAVVIDDFAAASAMTRHLIGLGHMRIGFITGNPNQTASSQRQQGYQSALKQAGLPADDRLIVGGLFTYRSGLDAAEQLLEQANPPSAIFASNDDMAAATVAVAHRRGLDVPGDLTVCGFDDSALATTIWPELTTIHQPIAAMSRAAVELLVTTIKGHRAGTSRRENGGDADGAANPHVVMDYTLVRRQSDAAPRRRPAARTRA